ncbi:MAG: hypothetical protein SVV67_09175 [Bacillota bacterium]|nr:hypothetical protein [Bacillota bacterium]
MEEEVSSNVSEPPNGWRRLLFLGPGLVWSARVVGVGSQVFATRARDYFRPDPTVGSNSDHLH